ncbi:MAG: archaellin/type IV pilin N-terminal domain-containing protein [Nanoarchaeota archaeon]|nr:archaellin/type IV pilin N-terminal domain-containing protein [Nanoarchaeota archaeon]
MLKNKRGISPLIATVLIIGFTVALAAVIMTWGQSFSKSMSQSTEESTEVQLACSQDVKFELKSVCWDSDALRLKLTVANNGNKDLKNITARVKVTESIIGVIPDLAEEGVPSEDPTLAAFGLKVFSVDPAGLDLATFGGADVTEVELIPLIEVGGKTVTCPTAIAKYGSVTRGEVVPSC